MCELILTVHGANKLKRSQVAVECLLKVRVPCSLKTMSIRRYFKSINRLPNPRGSLSTSIPSTAITVANHEVERVTGGVNKQERFLQEVRKHVRVKYLNQ